MKPVLLTPFMLIAMLSAYSSTPVQTTGAINDLTIKQTCTVTAQSTAYGIDCFGNPFSVTVTHTAQAGNCRDAYNLAVATAFSQANQAVADIQDSCEGPPNN
ncbi:MAG TPA: hypothetical protein PKE63_05985 [Lacibacter sp.]|nr:hypothetical protein [Lacibacter sp.]HMO90486.1 hypothetical protein [Lacibacter sp.]HMP86808.1 hypothetical protein [Lacibacter sp.]